MARYPLVPHARLTPLLLLAALAAAAQTSTNPERFQQAGVCSRCHVAQVLEWSISGHPRAATGCEECHGPSKAHVIDERNQVKPDKMPLGVAIAGLCQSCHTQGCPKTERRASCESCHDPHALFHPKATNRPAPGSEDDVLPRFESHLKQGEGLIEQRNWNAAQKELQAALRLYPNHPRASARLALVNRRLNPSLPGFDILDDQFDAETGLPLHVRVSGMPVEMVLIPGGETDLGDDAQPSARPVHSVSIAPFYLARTELTQGVWMMLDPGNPSVHRGDDLPVNNISWEDAQRWIAKLNGRIAGGGFRLPSEAEWESAARTASKDIDPGERAWYRENSMAAAGSGEFREIDAYAPRRAGAKRADSRGIHDLAGNVWEWCSTLMKPYPYDPRDGRESPDAPGLRVLRGGGFADSAGYLVPWFRHAERRDRRLPFNGMRLARSVPAR